MAKKKNVPTRKSPTQKLQEALSFITQLEEETTRLREFETRLSNEIGEVDRAFDESKRTVHMQEIEIDELKQDLQICEKWKDQHSKRVDELEPIVDICRPLLCEAAKVAESFARVLSAVHEQTKPSGT